MDIKELLERIAKGETDFIGIDLSQLTIEFRKNIGTHRSEIRLISAWVNLSDW